MRKVSAPKVAESGVLKACLDLLAAEKVWHRRWNTGAIKTGTRFFRFGQKGDADIVSAPHVGGIPVLLWIECKSTDGDQTEEQMEFQEEVEADGHHYLLVRDVDTLINWLKERGVR